MTRKDDTIYVLRTCNADMTSHGGFKYPKRGAVEAPDWRDDDQCGGGLHGLPWGVGDATLPNSSDDAVWQVIHVRVSDGYQHGTGGLIGKCKFRRGTVVYTGTRDGAIAYLDAHGAADKPVVFAVRISGYRGTSTSGDEGTSTSGEGGTLIIKYYDGARYRIAVGYIGENGLKPNTPYRLNDNHEFEEVPA